MESRYRMLKALPLILSPPKIRGTSSRGVGSDGGEVAMVLPTLVVTVRRGFPSEDALLGISIRTMATGLSAALESLPYNR